MSRPTSSSFTGSRSDANRIEAFLGAADLLVRPDRLPDRSTAGLSLKQWERPLPLSRKTEPTIVGERSTPGLRLAALLRRRRPFKTAAAVAADTGASVAAIGKMLERGGLPGALTLGRIVAAYGPEALIAIMDSPPAWLLSLAADVDPQRQEGQ